SSPGVPRAVAVIAGISDPAQAANHAAGPCRGAMQAGHAGGPCRAAWVPWGWPRARVDARRAGSSGGGGPGPPQTRIAGAPLADFGQKRQLGGVHRAVLVDEFGWIVAGEAVIGELRGARVAVFDAERAVDAGNRQECQAGTTRKRPH